MKGNFIEKLTIDTHNLKDTQLKLRMIGDKLKELISKYKFEIVAIEKGFTRFNKSTQQLYRVHGVANYIFSDFEQLYYPSGTIKKVITGKGNSSKEEVQNCLLKLYPNIKFENFDESDAFSIGETYFIEKGVKQCREKQSEK